MKNSNKGLQVHIEQTVWRDGGEWVRRTTVTRYSLHATKGFRKDGPKQSMIQRANVKPPLWKTQHLCEFIKPGKVLSDRLKEAVEG